MNITDLAARLDEFFGLAPTDPASLGTWIACSEIGLAIALLNVNPPDADARVPPRSRGGIIPGLVRARSLDEVAASAAALDLGNKTDPCNQSKAETRPYE